MTPLIPIAAVAVVGLVGLLGTLSSREVVSSLPVRGGSVKLVDLTHLRLPHGGRRTRPPAAIVIHYSAGKAGGVVADIARQLIRHKASYNYIIDRDGTIYMLVDPANIAHHAGGGSMVDGRYPNEATIGVSFVNVGWPPFRREGWPRLAPPPVEIQQRAYKWNDNDERFRNLSSASWEPFPAKQLEAGAVLLAKLHREHGLAANALAGHQTLFGHSELAPWKADPGPAFPFGRFTADVLRRISRPANVA